MLALNITFYKFEYGFVVVFNKGTLQQEVETTLKIIITNTAFPQFKYNLVVFGLVSPAEQKIEAWTKIVTANSTLN